MLVFGLAANIQAAPVTIEVTATIAVVDGDYAGEIAPTQTMFGTFIFDTDEANADPNPITTPSDNPGHEFSSFYEFTGPPYEVTLSIPVTPPAIPYGFDDTAPVAVVVNDNLELTADDTAGFISPGFYDWIEILGSTTTGACLLTPPDECAPDEFSPVDGEEWTLALFSDTSWFSDGSIIPDNLPESFTSLIVGGRFNEEGDETGFVIATIDEMTVSTVPVPAAVWLFGSALGLLGWRRRKAG